MRLIDKVAALPKVELKSIEIDVSSVFKEKAGTTFFTFSQPSTKTIYDTTKKAQWLQMQFKEWPEQLCDTVAIMLATLDKSVLPEEDRPQAELALGHFVDRISLEDFSDFATKFFETFPHLNNSKKEMEKAKKN